MTEVYAGEIRYPGPMASEVMARWATWVGDLPEPMTSAVVLHPADHPGPGERRRAGGSGSWVAVHGCFPGAMAEGRRLVDGWRRWSEPTVDRFGPTRAEELGELDPLAIRWGDAITTIDWLLRSSNDVIEALATAGEGPERMAVEMRLLAGAVRARAGPHLVGRPDLRLQLIGIPAGPDDEAAVLQRIIDLRTELADLGAIADGAPAYSAPPRTRRRAVEAPDDARGPMEGEPSSTGEQHR